MTPSRISISACLAIALLGATSCNAPDAKQEQTTITGQVSTTTWKTVVAQAAILDRLAPATKAEGEAFKQDLQGIVDWQARLSEADRQAIAYWNDTPAAMRWSEVIRDEIIRVTMFPPRAARALALMHVAMYDALVLAEKAKAAVPRAPLSTLDSRIQSLALAESAAGGLSEQAAVCAAAAGILSYIFTDHTADFNNKATLAATTRVAAGVNTQSEVDAGLRLGAAVAEALIERNKADGAEKTPKLPLSHTPDQWMVEKPMEPLAGSWKTWQLESGSQFRLSAPITDPNDANFAKQLEEVRNMPSSLTTLQVEKVKFWNFDVPALLWDDILRQTIKDKRAAITTSGQEKIDDLARAGVNTAQSSRVLATMHMGLADAFIAAWDTKYVVLRKRPVMLLPANFKTTFPTPPHPSYPSGHATASAAASTILARYFPEKTGYYKDQAQEAAMSRLWGGIHYRSDNDDGLILGTKVGEFHLKKDGELGLLP
jgi:hypothetical protein